MAEVLHPLYQPVAQTKQNGLRDYYLETSPEKQRFVSKLTQPTKDDNPEEVPTIQRPSIAFQPNWDDYVARVKRLAEQRSPSETYELPEGFPNSITGARAWSGMDVSGLEEFVIRLTATHITEIESALQFFKDIPGGNGPDQLAKDLFPLETLGPYIEEISKDLHTGRGLTILRGLDPTKYTPWENVIIFAGISSYLGDQRGCQDRYGNMLTHLVDMGFKFGACSERTPTFTAGALPYHNDVCDILAMYVQSCASTGGESILSPSAAVYNEIAATRPDLIKVLSDPIWTYDKDKPPTVWRSRAILFSEPDHGPFFCFSRQKITGSEFYPLSATLPAMTEAQAEALDLVHWVAEKHGMVMRLDPGDVLLYNNLALLHGRNAFTDDADAGEEVKGRRHILRLWVRNENLAWKTPEGLASDWHSVYGDSERRARAHWRIRAQDTDKDRVIGHKATCS